MADSVDVKVSDGLIRPIIDAKITEAIAGALRGYENLVANAVARVLSQKVDSKGMPSNQGYSSDVPFLEWLCNDAIQRAAKVAVQKWVEANTETLQDEFLRQLKTKKGPLVKAFIGGLAGSLQSEYRFSVNVAFKSRD
jgi:hypothetical protein